MTRIFSFFCIIHRTDCLSFTPIVCRIVCFSVRSCCARVFDLVVRVSIFDPALVVVGVALSILKTATELLIDKGDVKNVQVYAEVIFDKFVDEDIIG